MLIIKDKAHYDKVMAFAEGAGLVGDLVKELEYLRKYTWCDCPTRVNLFSDFAPNSFYWTMEAKKKDASWAQVSVGGLIYHADHRYPTLTCPIGETAGRWSVHTGGDKWPTRS